MFLVVSKHDKDAKINAFSTAFEEEKFPNTPKKHT
jgi:hypothetical protein